MQADHRAGKGERECTARRATSARHPEQKSAPLQDKARCPPSPDAGVTRQLSPKICRLRQQARSSFGSPTREADYSDSATSAHDQAPAPSRTKYQIKAPNSSASATRWIAPRSTPVGADIS